jgi:hypothetical protein
MIVIKRDYKEGVSKSSHPIHNLLLLVTEPQTRDNIMLAFRWQDWGK